MLETHWNILKKKLYKTCIVENGDILLDNLVKLTKPDLSDIQKIITEWLNDYILRQLDERRSGIYAIEQSISESAANDSEIEETQNSEYIKVVNASSVGHRNSQIWAEMISLFLREFEHASLSRRILSSYTELCTKWKWNESIAKKKSRQILARILNEYFHEARTDGRERLQDWQIIEQAIHALENEVNQSGNSKMWEHYNVDSAWLAVSLLNYFQRPVQSRTIKSQPKRANSLEQILTFLHEFRPQNVNAELSDLEGELSSEESVVDVLFNEEIEAILKDCIQCQSCPTMLTDQERYIIQSKFLNSNDNEITDQELAKLLEISRETLRKRYKSALAKLNKCLSDFKVDF